MALVKLSQIQVLCNGMAPLSHSWSFNEFCLYFLLFFCFLFFFCFYICLLGNFARLVYASCNSTGSRAAGQFGDATELQQRERGVMEEEWRGLLAAKGSPSITKTVYDIDIDIAVAPINTPNSAEESSRVVEQSLHAFGFYHKVLSEETLL